MLSTKQRANLRSLANRLDPVAQIGKDELSQSSLKQIDELLYHKELIKISVLKSVNTPIKELMQELTEKLSCDAVQVIGSKITIYKYSSKKDIKHIEID